MVPFSGRPEESQMDALRKREGVYVTYMVLPKYGTNILIGTKVITINPKCRTITAVLHLFWDCTHSKFMRLTCFSVAPRFPVVSSHHLCTNLNLSSLSPSRTSF